MAGKSAANADKGKDTDTRPSQQEVLSPRSATVRLLLVEESVGELKSGMADLNLSMDRMTRQRELVIVALPQVTNPQRVDEPRRRPVQFAVVRRPANNSTSDLTSQEGEKRDFRVPRNQERDQEVQESGEYSSEVEEMAQLPGIDGISGKIVGKITEKDHKTIR